MCVSKRGGPGPLFHSLYTYQVFNPRNPRNWFISNWYKTKKQARGLFANPRATLATLAALMEWNMSSGFLKRQAVIAMALAWQGPMNARALPKAKQKIGVEELLAWCYRVELPKAPRIPDAPQAMRGAWEKVAEWADELSLAGLADNRFGVVPDFFAQELPHNDALIVHEAVCALDVLEVDGLADWSPFGAAEGCDAGLLAAYAGRARSRVLTVDAEGRARLRKPLRNLIFHHALLGAAPDWEIAPFVEDVERWDNGAVKYFKRSGQWETGAFGDVWVEYETAVSADPRSKRLPEDVLVKPVLTPDPTDDAVGRAHYELWRLALDVVAADLFGRLERFEVVGCARSLRPWEEGVGAPRVGRILRDLTRAPIRVVRDGPKKIARSA